MSIIKLEKINKTYPLGREKYHALKNISFEISAWEMAAIIGPSGSGKTTLLNVIGLIDGFDDGKFFFNGKDVTKINDIQASKIRNEEIGFVFQDFSLIENESVLFNVMLPMYFSKIPAKSMKQKALRALEEVGLPQNQFKKRAKYLSGGQKQRIAIARAIVNDPQIILADEPSGALDSESTTQIMKLFKELNDQSKTILIVTHDKTVSSYCSREICMKDGAILL